MNSQYNYSNLSGLYDINADIINTNSLYVNNVSFSDTLNRLTTDETNISALENATFSIGTVTTLTSAYSATASLSGTPSARILNLGIPAGQNGSGTTPTISIGTVTSTSTPSVVQTGTQNNPILNFGLVAGATGPSGNTPSFSIGTVTSSTSPSVTMTGTTTNPILNFGLSSGPTGATGPQGSTGSTGATGSSPSFSIGTVSASITPSVTITGTSNNPILNFGLVSGSSGSNGLSAIQPTFSIGTVTNLPSGSTPAVTMTGTTISPVLNFSLVSGVNGSNGSNGSDGAKGDKGSKGDKGDTGDTGPAGPSVEVIGAAAMALAAATAAGLALAVADIATLNADVAALDADVAVLDGSVSTLESDVATLQSKTLYQSTNTASTYTRFESDVRINNGVSDRILLKTSGTSEFADNVQIDGTATFNGNIVAGSQTNSGTINCNSIDFHSSSGNQTMNIAQGGGLANVINIGNNILDVINLNGIVNMPYNTTLTGFFSQW